MIIGDPSSPLLSIISENQIVACDGARYFLPRTALTAVLRSINRLGDLSEGLAQLAELAFLQRRMKIVSAIGDLISNLPCPEPVRQTGRFYKLLAQVRSKPRDMARTNLQAFADFGPERVRAKAFNALGFVSYSQNDMPMALECYLEASRAATSRSISDISAAMLAQSTFPVFAAIAGDSHRALLELERLEPLIIRVGSADASLFYHFQNNLAVELSQVGRHEEALYRNNLTINSPLVEFLPSFIETRNEVLQSMPKKNRSRGVLNLSCGSSTDNVRSQHKNLSANRDPSNRQEPVATLSDGTVPQTSIIAFPPERLSTPEATRCKRPLSAISESQLDGMSKHQKRLLLIAIAQSDEIGDAQLVETIKALRVLRRDEPAPRLDRYSAELFPERSPELGPAGPTAVEVSPARNQPRKTINLESTGCLERQVLRLINGGMTPHEFAAILSALRDCRDELRRNTILNRMISFSYRETPEHVLSEERWRRRHEWHFEDETDQ